MIRKEILDRELEIQEKIMEQTIMKKVKEGKMDNENTRLIHLPCIIEFTEEGCISSITTRNSEIITHFNSANRAENFDRRIKKGIEWWENE